MSREFALRPTPAIARQIMKLKAIQPDTVVDPAIVELAEQDLYRPDPDDYETMTLPQHKLVQDVLDFELRALVSVPNRLFLSERVKLWLLPILRAAQISGVTDIVFADKLAETEARALTKVRGFTVHEAGSAGSILPDDTSIPRDALLLCTSGINSLSGSTTTVPNLCMEFPRSITITDSLRTNQSRLFPQMPTLLSVFNKDHFGEVLTADLAFMFNTSYAISRAAS